MAIDNNSNNMSRLFGQASQNQGQQQGTGYTNLNRLFQANKDNQLGQKVAGDIQNQIGGVQNQLKQQQDQFNKQAQQESGKFNESDRAAVLGRLNSTEQAGDITDEDVNKFQTYRSGEYKGPQNLGDTSAISQQASGLAQQVSNFNPAGTQELLRRSVGGNRYTSGQSRLDSLLMDKSKLQPVARQASGLGQQLSQANMAAQGQAELLKNQAKQFGIQTNELLNQGLGNIDTSVQGQLKAAQDAETARQAKMQQLDETINGKLVDSGKKDANGNPIMVRQPISTNDYTRLDTISQGLAGIANEGQLAGLFGKGNLVDQNAARQNAINASQQQIRKAAENEALRLTINKYGNYGFSGSDILNKGLNNQTLGAGFFASRPFLNDLATKLYTNPLSASTNQKNQDFLSNAGVLGKAAYEGKGADAYKNLLASIQSQSQGATNLTEQGVASDAARKNYENLTRLLGKTASEAKYRTADDKYEAGKIALDAEQIKKSLGY
jgi:hypothetical protein